MTVTSPFSILLIPPPAASSAIPPLTLVQAKHMIADGLLKTRRWKGRTDGFANGGEWLMDVLDRLSARYDTFHLSCLDEIEPAQLKDLVAALSKKPPGFRLSLACTINSESASNFAAMDGCGSIVHIQWRVTGPLPELGFFRNFSRAGVWNHLVLDGAAANSKNGNTVARHPNIIHSWEATDAAGNREFNADDGYGQVARLPGRPLWQAVNDPLYRLLWVDHFGKNWLLRSRVDDSGNRLYCVGENLEYHFCPPDQLPDGYLDKICAMVAAGGTVPATHVRSNLARAFLVGYVEEKGVIAGNSSLKNPRPAYIDSVRRQSGLDLSGFVERGYTSVRPEYRGLGLGTKLLAGLTQRAGDRKIFSVISEDNAATQTIAKRNRTRKVARYFSEKAGKPVGVWMPEWMIAEKERKT